MQGALSDGECEFPRAQESLDLLHQLCEHSFPAPLHSLLLAKHTALEEMRNTSTATFSSETETACSGVAKYGKASQLATAMSGAELGDGLGVVGDNISNVISSVLLVSCSVNAKGNMWAQSLLGGDEAGASAGCGGEAGGGGGGGDGPIGQLLLAKPLQRLLLPSRAAMQTWRTWGQKGRAPPVLVPGVGLGLGPGVGPIAGLDTALNTKKCFNGQQKRRRAITASAGCPGNENNGAGPHDGINIAVKPADDATAGDNDKSRAQHFSRKTSSEIESDSKATIAALAAGAIGRTVQIHEHRIPASLDLVHWSIDQLGTSLSLLAKKCASTTLMMENLNPELPRSHLRGNTVPSQALALSEGSDALLASKQQQQASSDKSYSPAASCVSMSANLTAAALVRNALQMKQKRKRDDVIELELGSDKVAAGTAAVGAALPTLNNATGVDYPLVAPLPVPLPTPVPALVPVADSVHTTPSCDNPAAQMASDCRAQFAASLELLRRLPPANPSDIQVLSKYHC